MLEIAPAASITWRFDAEGNSVATACFEGAASELTIDSDVTVQQYHLAAPYLSQPDAALHWSRDDAEVLAPYRHGAGIGAKWDAVAAWLDRLGCGGDRLTVSLLARINEAIAGTLTYVVRHEEGVQQAEATLALGSGACRDFAALFIEAVRRRGMAARFVTGYLCAGSEVEAMATHAWAEVYLSDVGWTGFDPTLGLPVEANHVAVAVSRRPDRVPPVEGSFAGAADATMDIGVRITRL